MHLEEGVVLSPLSKVSLSLCFFLTENCKKNYFKNHEWWNWKHVFCRFYAYWISKEFSTIMVYLFCSIKYHEHIKLRALHHESNCIDCIVKTLMRKHLYLMPTYNSVNKIKAVPTLLPSQSQMNAISNKDSLYIFIMINHSWPWNLQ